MDRTVPRTGSEEIELYIRTYFSLLRASADVQIRSLEPAHAGMGSSLHPLARSAQPDMSALIYSSLRLPACIAEVERVVLGQSQEVFRQRGFADVEAWRPAPAPARRRRSFFDGGNTLAVYIASSTDIDDLLPMLTAFQIEWNKMHLRLRAGEARAILQSAPLGAEALAGLSRVIDVAADDLDRLRRVWRDSFEGMLRAMASRPKGFRVRLLAGSLNDYRRATQSWWDDVEAACPDVVSRPVYFVSSNTHSLVNLYSGFALRHEAELVAMLADPQHADLAEEWRDIEARHVPSSRENFLYYLMKKTRGSPEGDRLRAIRSGEESSMGVVRVQSQHSADLETQVIDLRRMQPQAVDPRLRRAELSALTETDAVVVNIDYPLGLAAYQVLSEVAQQVGEVRGVYVMGKSAVLNGVIGDVVIPSVVYDEQSQNTYLFRNCFDAAGVGDHLVYGTALDNQKAVSVRGTFLQTPRYMEVFYREGYSDIEMEAGPYLSAVYEMSRARRYPDDEIVDLHSLPFDLGILHYASDTPFSKAKNLGAGSLSYFGMDPTYAASVAIWRRIFALEVARLQGQPAANSMAVR
jgi:hypothetical protein